MVSLAECSALESNISDKGLFRVAIFVDVTRLMEGGSILGTNLAASLVDHVRRGECPKSSRSGEKRGTITLDFPKPFGCAFSGLFWKKSSTSTPLDESATGVQPLESGD